MEHDNNMTWDNIHIDHIKPIRAFKKQEDTEHAECAHYTNLQPLLAEDKLSKGGRWSQVDENFWRKNILRNDLFLKIYTPQR